MGADDQCEGCNALRHIHAMWSAKAQKAITLFAAIFISTSFVLDVTSMAISYKNFQSLKIKFDVNQMNNGGNDSFALPEAHNDDSRHTGVEKRLNHTVPRRKFGLDNTIEN